MRPAPFLPRWSTFRARRVAHVLLGLLNIGLLTASAFASTVIAPAGPRVPRSVVFILSDDHRYDAMGFLGHPFLQTPHLDSIATQGVHLRNACVTTALCSPSRASILTGLTSHRHRVVDNYNAIAPGMRFFPQDLQQAGYRTAFIGKWHMGGESDAPRPGFDHWVSFRGQGSYLPEANGLNVNGQRVPQRGYITDELTDYAIDWLRTQRPKEQPFFLYLSHKAVHANFTPAERHRGRYANAAVPRPGNADETPAELAAKPRWVRDQRNSWHGADFPYHSDLDIADYYRSYCETLLAVDDSVGRVLAQLKELDCLEDTLVIYMGDNGFMFGEHGLIDKRVAYEESIRVPLLMQCPALFPGGRTVDEVVANIDLAPTILEAVGLTPQPGLDGRSFLGLAQGKSVPWCDDFLYVYYWERNYPQTPTTFALRTNRYKYITYYGIWDVDELYDLREDPAERRNLIASPEHRAIARDLEQRLYRRLAAEGGMQIPLNAPKGGIYNKRLAPREGSEAADFPPALVVPAPLNRGAQ
jgi:N-acetylglucosamine-6-sulfatase